MILNTFGTGEINFACALMALGIPLDELNPCTIVAHQNNKIYSRYHFNAISVDGVYRTGDMSNMWSQAESIPEAHPLRIISDFVRRAPAKMKLAEWFDYVHSVFSIGHVKNFDDAQKHINLFPEDGASYCLAFILNRRELISLHYRANRETFISDGTSSAMIGINMPKYAKQELLNRMNG